MAKSLPISANASLAISGEGPYTSTNFLRAPGLELFGEVQQQLRQVGFLHDPVGARAVQTLEGRQKFVLQADLLKRPLLFLIQQIDAFALRRIAFMRDRRDAFVTLLDRSVPFLCEAQDDLFEFGGIVGKCSQRRVVHDMRILHDVHGMNRLKI